MRCAQKGTAQPLLREAGGIRKRYTMNRSTLLRTLLGCTMMISATAAFAQDAQDAQPDSSDATADAAIAGTQDVGDAEAKLQLLMAQVEALQSQVEDMKKAMVKATPSWKGAPQVE